MKRVNTAIAALFLLALGLMLAMVLLSAENIGAALVSGWRAREAGAGTSLLDKAAYVTDHSESAVNDALDRTHVFIEIYGGVQRLTGQRLVEDSTPDTSVTKLENGMLTFCGLDSAYIDPAGNAAKTAAFAARLDSAGIPFLAAVAPGKVADTEAELPAALHDWGNEIADDYLRGLAEAGVETLDLRPAFDAREDRDGFFFRTDHHWKPEGAFFACGVLTEELAARYGFAVQEEALDEDNYEKTVYENLFLGSQGKRVGSLYAGVDDFTVYTPKFETAFTYEIPERETVRAGDFNEALCFPERIAARDWFGGNPYTYYSGGDWAKAVITNENNPDGPRVVLIRDSFSCALAPFLALQCSELTTIDLRYYQGDLLAELQAEQPDLVLLLYTASSTRLENMFAFS